MLTRGLVLALCAVLWLAAPARAEGEPVSTSQPQVTGTAAVGEALKAGRGGWDPAEVEVAFRWLRDERPIAGATARSYRVVLDDLRHRLSVTATATDAQGAGSAATSEQTGPVVRGTLTLRQSPHVVGTSRFGRTVQADPGRWSRTPQRTTYQWFRGPRPIDGATGRRYALAPDDVGRHVRVRVGVKVPGYRLATATSPRTAPVGHRVDLRRTVTYHVETRGRITTSMRDFKRLAQQSYDDPRGWRGKGVRFVRVERRGSFTLVLAEASTVPSFSSGCSSTYSCRVGRYVIINQTRWNRATPPWNAAGGSLRDYRHMVVNHETGHWLGYGHAGCSGRGKLAPVMMQQSKGLDGCRFNPWPTPRELG
ncbi:DUF3152 domain-containing protein [Nocardioides psychrotolerans]|uniref:DUF3152 domain-containing protein n=1 Tax=Nocardioides psychrotolerans TaxID=1005945 RepID=UPI00116013E9|nr:DUF3152 domain-containing protein [Nocardioides psychrotolerans]